MFSKLHCSWNAHLFDRNIHIAYSGWGKAPNGLRPSSSSFNRHTALTAILVNQLQLVFAMLCGLNDFNGLKPLINQALCVQLYNVFLCMR